MPPVRLTPRPPVPVLVHAAALAALAALPACGDKDGTTTSASTDVHPTAGPCAHDPMSPGCSTTDTTGPTTSAGTTVDQHPTAGPCIHDPDAPECATTGGSTATATSTSDTTGTGTGTDTDTGTDTTGTSG